MVTITLFPFTHLFREFQCRLESEYLILLRELGLHEFLRTEVKVHGNL